MDRKNFFIAFGIFVIVLVVIFFFIFGNSITGNIVLQPDSEIIPEEFLKWDVKFTGNESVLYDLQNLTRDQICIVPKDKDLNSIFFEGEEYFYPETVTIYGGDEKQIVSTKNLKTESEVDGSICFLIDPLEYSFYTIGESSITINGESGYSSTDVSVTQQNRFSHLNLSDGSLVLYHPFDVNATSNTAYDYTNESNDGTVGNGTLFNSTGGYYGGGYFFDGVDDFISVADDSSLDISGSHTIAIWIYPTANGQSARSAIFGKSRDTNCCGQTYGFRQRSNNTINYDTSLDPHVGTHSLHSTETISLNTWTHIAGTYDGSEKRLYVNGVLSASGSYSGNIKQTTADFYFATVDTSQVPENRRYEGYLDEAMVFNRALSETEVGEIYNGTFQRFMDPGTMNFTSLDFGTNNTVDITIPECQQLNGSQISFSINGGTYNLLNSTCMFDGYSISGNLTDAFLTLQLATNTTDDFYSPLVVGNITLNDYFISSGTTPTIIYESPTPSNASTINDTNSFYLNVTVNDDSETSAWFDLNRSLIGYWNFDNTNSTGVFDDSTYSNFGLFKGNLGTSNLTTAKRGDGLIFDGNNDSILIPDSDVLDSVDNLTISSWVKPTDLSQIQGIVSKGSYSLKINSDDKPYFEIITDGSIGSWENTSNLGVEGIVFSLATHNGKLYVGTGTANGGVYVYNETDNIWTETANLPGASRANSLTSHNGKLYAGTRATGGLNEGDVFIYNETSDTWTNTSNLIDARGVNSLITFNGELYAGAESSETSVFIYNETSDTWTNTTDFTIEVNSLTVHNGKLYAGARSGIVYIYNESANTWASIGTLPGAVDVWSLVTHNAKLYAGTRSNGDVFVYNETDGVWYNTTNLPGATQVYSLTTYNGNLYAGTGSSNADLFLYNESDNGWYNTTNLPGATTIYSLATFNGKLYAGTSLAGDVFFTGNGSAVYSNTTLTNNSWTNVVGTYDGSNLKLYQDGELVGEKSFVGGSIFSNDEDLLIGANKGSSLSSFGSSFDEYFQGTIDEVLIFNRSLSHSEALALYNNSANRLENNFAGLSNGVYNYLTYAINDFGNLNITDYREVTINFTADEDAPTIVYENPTPDNASTINDSFVYLNTTINDSSETSAWFDFNRDLVGYWSMDYYNSTGVFDNSSYGDFGVFNGDLSTSKVTSGKRGNAFDFDGDGDYVDGGSDPLEGDGPFSITAWINSDDLSLCQETWGCGIVRSTGVNAIGDFFLSVDNDGSVHFANWRNSGTDTDGLSFTPDGVVLASNWYHLVAVWNGTTNKIYVNGTEQSLSTESTVSGWGTGYEIGRQFGSHPYNFDGKIDEVLIFNRSLSSAEVLALYDNSANRLENNFTGLSNGIYSYLTYAVDVSGNLNVTAEREVTVLIDGTPPNVTYESPTPENNSIVSQSNTVNIVANITDNFDSNTSSWIDFNNDLVAYFSFDDTNSTGVFDNSSYNNFGVFEDNLGTSNLTTGIRGDAIEFDGTDDEVDFSDIYIGTVHSTSLWFKLNDDEYSNYEVSFGGASSTPGAYTLAIRPGTNQIFYNDGTNNCNVNIGDFTTDWYHVASIRDGTNVTFYLNGTSQGSCTLGGSNAVTVGQIGQRGTGDLDFVGLMDEAMLFNRTLSSSEVLALYDSKSNNFNASFSGLSEGQQNYTVYAIDESGNLNDTSYRTFNVDGTSPNVTYESPTPENNSAVGLNTNVTIVANITDNFDSNTSSWIDFNNDLVGYWGMDYFNSTGIFDNSTHDNFGTFNNGVGASNITTGKRGSGLEFDGGNYINVDSVSSQINLIEGSFSLWTKFSDPSDLSDSEFYGLFEIGMSASTTDLIAMRKLDNNNIAFRYRRGTNYNALISDINHFTNWNHLVGTWNESHIAIYNNGTLISVETKGANITAGTLNQGSIGSDAQSTKDAFFNGTIDEVMVFNRSLSPNEVLALYDSKANKFNATFSGLSEGQQNYTVYAIDEAGNVNDTSYRTFTLDGIIPTIIYESPTPSDGTKVNDNFVYLNTSIVDESETSAWFDFNKSLLGYWNFDNINSTGMFDDSSYSHFGSFDSEIGTSNITVGQRGNALAFGGINDSSVSIANSSIFDITKDHTISVWIYPVANGQSGRSSIVGKSASSPTCCGYVYGLRLNSTNFINYDTTTSGPSTDSLSSAQPVSLNTWTHVVATYNGSEKRIYIDGSLVSNSPYTESLLQSGSPIRFGNLDDSQGREDRNYEGYMDEVMIFNRSISSDEVLALYNNSANRLENNFTDLSEGTYDYSAYAIDEAGNLNITSPDRQVTVDQTFPTIIYESPTPSDGATVNNSFVYLNTTINDESETSAWFDWNKSLIGYWNFDNTNSTGVFDDSTYSHFGTFNGDVGEGTITSGRRGSGLEFDGVGDYINVSSIPGLDNIPELSISLWFEQNNVLANERVIMQNFSGAHDISIAPYGGDLYFEVGSGQNSFAWWEGYGGNVSNNEWIHVVAIFNGSESANADKVKIYVNGDSKPLSISGTFPTETANFTGIPFRISDTGDEFNGTIDEVMVFSRALSSLEVLALYNNSANRLENNFTNLNNGVYNYSAYAIDEAGNLNMTIPDRQVTVSFSVDSCSYSGSGNWDVDCSDNCTITSNVVIDGSNVSIVGDGRFTLLANVTNFANLYIDGGGGHCTVTCMQGNCFLT